MWGNANGLCVNARTGNANESETAGIMLFLWDDLNVKSTKAHCYGENLFRIWLQSSVNALSFHLSLSSCKMRTSKKQSVESRADKMLALKNTHSNGYYVQCKLPYRENGYVLCILSKFGYIQFNGKQQWFSMRGYPFSFKLGTQQQWIHSQSFRPFSFLNIQIIYFDLLFTKL